MEGTTGRDSRVPVEGVRAPSPEWTNDPQYTLAAQWDPWEDIVPDIEQYRPERIAKADPAFLKRNVVFEARNLIVL